MSPASLLLFLLDVALKGTLLLILAFALTRLGLRRASAGTRHLVWACCLMGLLVLPLLSAMMPAWRLPVSFGPLWRLGNAELREDAIVFLPDEPAAKVEPPERAEPENPKPVLVASREAPPPRGAAAKEPVARPDIVTQPEPIALWIVSIWAAGALLLAAWLLGGWLSLVRLVRHCRPVADGPLAQMLAEVASQLGIRRTVHLLTTSQRRIPMTWGTWRPIVLLPEEAHTWTPERLRMVLLHELGHVQRWDCLVQILAYVVRGLYWFHPLVWLVLWQLRLEQEQACDDVVLASGVSAPDYAEHLLAVTTGLSEYFWTRPLALGMGRESALRRRLVHLLDEDRNHRPAPRRMFWATIGGTLILTVCLAMVEITLTPAAALHLPQDALREKGEDKSTPLSKKLNEVHDKLAKHYVAPVDEKALTEHALKGLLQALKDPYTDYLSAEDLSRFDSQVKGMLIGIGAQLKMVDGRLTVVTPTDDSPALKAGLRPGDLIEAIDGKSTEGLTLAQAVQRLLGKADSVVKLKVVHPEGVVEEIAITRSEIRFKSINGFQRDASGQWRFLLDADHKIGYLHVYQFSARTASEMRDTIVGLQKDGLKGLILDLRFCPGGFLEQAVETCKLFLDRGTILTTRGPGKEEKTWKADEKNALGKFPLMVLVNESTASAAEIVAGALRDHERAILLGTRTFGKGSVQSVMKLDSGGALKITTAYHYLPSGRNIQKRPGEKTWGVDPTDGYYIPLSQATTDALQKDAQKRALLGLKKEEQPKIKRLTPKIIEEQHADPQLAAALRSMVARLTGGEFLKVGKDNALLLDHTLRIEELRRRREQLRQNLNQVEQDILDLQQVVGKEKAREK